MESSFMKFSSETANLDAAFTELNTTDVILSTKLRQQEYFIQALQAGICNFKVAEAMQTTEVKGNNKVIHPYSCMKK